MKETPYQIEERLLRAEWVATLEAEKAGKIIEWADMMHLSHRTFDLFERFTRGER